VDPLYSQETLHSPQDWWTKLVNARRAPHPDHNRSIARERGGEKRRKKTSSSVVDILIVCLYTFHRVVVCSCQYSWYCVVVSGIVHTVLMSRSPLYFLHFTDFTTLPSTSPFLSRDSIETSRLSLSFLRVDYCTTILTSVIHTLVSVRCCALVAYPR